MLFDQHAKLVATVQQSFTQHFPHPAWVEHDPEEIWQSVLSTVSSVIAKLSCDTGDIDAMGITNQRETTVVWDKKSGQTVYPAIVWQDRRTAEYCQQLSQHSVMIHQKTGLILDPYFSASKIAWILDNVDGARQAAENGELAFGTVETFLLWRLTSGRSYYTDMINASRSVLFNIKSLQWDDELLELFNIPRTMLPIVADNCADFGVSDKGLFGQSIVITAMAGDQQAAEFGQTCFEPGLIKTTYGTGCFMLLNTGSVLLYSHHLLLSTVAYCLDGQACYALEGSIFMAGAIIQWLRDKLGILGHAAESEAIANSLDSNDGVYLLPALTGMGAPHWQPEAKAAIIGMTRHTDRRHIIRAGLETVAYQTKDLMQAMDQDGAMLSKQMYVDGGMATNNFLMQFVADLLNIEVVRSACLETTALGAAYLAGLHIGFCQSMAQLKQLWQGEKTFQSTLCEQDRHKRYHHWQQALAHILK